MKSIVALVVFAIIIAFSIMILSPSQLVFAYHSPDLKDIYEGNYFKGPYTVNSIQKYHSFPYQIELFLYPEWAEDKTFDLFVLSYKDKDQIGWKRFQAGDKLEIDIRYEGKGNYSVLFRKFKTNSAEKEEICCFRFMNFGSFPELTGGYLGY